MINIIWFFIIAIGVIFGLATGKGEILSKSIINSTEDSVTLIIGLIGLMCLWSGVMKIAQKSGITDKLSKLLNPILRVLFKTASPEAMGSILMNLTSNMMGLSNAATPFGVKAMEEMQKGNKDKDTATNDMALFLVLNAACIQLIPTSVISMRAACGSSNPGVIIVPAILATGFASIMGIFYCKILERFF
ncbi:nucleoside recognition domain-containing protein [Clostridium grantii]|uniref:Spore maturation protein A n=1 Tax=Clostridium grantii DSM 8605 TaxID=1121316 RepID=A0A1M5XIG9_9CLOT|nr:nucleoside recognition domain-containing protein [Clostridium grantii]SHH99546.1 spore maturation protein A [Clostridium grantii DSM 8605]